MPADPAASLHGTDGTAETVAGRLAAWGLGLTLEQVPESARRAASRHLLDAIGAGIAAARTHAADPAVSVALGLGGPPEATVWGTGQKVPSSRTGSTSAGCTRPRRAGSSRPQSWRLGCSA